MIHAVDIGCEPSPSVPAESLLQDGWATYLLFFAVSSRMSDSGYLTDLGVAVVECKECVIAKFGYPNDEGRPEHPLYNHGLAEADSSVLEIIPSHWAEELSAQTTASASRIWGGRGVSTPGSDRVIRHFIILLKEATFECLASSLVVDRFFPTFDEAFAYVIGKLKEH